MSDDLRPPRDPRTDWGLAPLGALAAEVDLDEVVSRVVAPNPSPMTLDGTNTYVVAAPGAGEAVVVDPGPVDADHRARVERVLARRDAACVLVAVTHHHPDHAAAAAAWADGFGCRVAAPTAEVAGPGGAVVADGDVIGPPSATLVAFATPGHTADHTAYRLAHGPLLSGDHVLGRGTSVVAWPEGDLVAYLDSLRRVLDLGAAALLPGHGPELAQDPAAVVAYYLEHRAFRERQILAVLAGGPATVDAIVASIYAEVDRGLWPAATLSTRAGLDKLAREGAISWDGERAASIV